MQTAIPASAFSSPISLTHVTSIALCRPNRDIIAVCGSNLRHNRIAIKHFTPTIRLIHNNHQLPSTAINCHQLPSTTTQFIFRPHQEDHNNVQKSPRHCPGAGQQRPSNCSTSDDYTICENDHTSSPKCKQPARVPRESPRPLQQSTQCRKHAKERARCWDRTGWCTGMWRRDETAN